MIELAVGPLHGVVALLAGGRESRMWNRTERLVVVVLVAAHARRARDGVVVVDVAIGALPRWNCMRSRQRKSRLRVIKCRRLPCQSVVANLAGPRESTGNVARVGRVLEICQVAGNTSRARQVVIVVGMAIGTLTWRHGVRSRQREVDHGVIKGRWSPCDCRVALCAIRGEVCGHVIRIGRLLKILEVAAHTGGAGDVEIAVDMAVAALPRRNCMSSGQREAHRTVIKVGVEPGVSAMAQSAVR